LANKIEKYEFSILSIVWNTILDKFNATNKNLQKETAELSRVVGLYEGLVAFVNSLRSEYDVFEEEAKKVVDITHMKNLGEYSGNVYMMNRQLKGSKFKEYGELSCLRPSW
jgi:hypothetical protein